MADTITTVTANGNEIEVIEATYNFGKKFIAKRGGLSRTANSQAKAVELLAKALEHKQLVFARKHTKETTNHDDLSTPISN